MKDLVFAEKIKSGGIDYNIQVTFIFDDYPEKEFLKDLQYIKDYNAKQSFSDDKEERKKELDFKFRSLPTITYDNFRDSMQAFAKMFFYTIKSNMHLATSQDFNLQLKLKRVPDGDWYFSYNDEDNPSDEENACFYVAGMWLINNVTIPRANGSGDFSLVQRYLLHELIHHKDLIEKHNFFEKENNHYANKIKRLYMRKSAYFLNCLYTSLFNLREEGLADFNARKENPMDINLEAIKKYNDSLVVLSTLRKKSVSENYYIKQIGYENLTPTGEYTMGRNMCMTIALSLCKKNNKPFTIKISSDTLSSTQITLNDALSTNKTVYIGNIDRQIISEAIKSIYPVGHYYFVKEYEKACDVLGIKEEYRIMTVRRFYSIIHNAIQGLKKEKIARLTGSGFRYAEPDLKDTVDPEEYGSHFGRS